MTACTCSDGGAGVAACNEAGDGTEACECVGNGTGGGDTADTYVEGLEKTGSQGHFTVRLLNSNPIPKDLTYYTWTLEVLDPDGKAVEGVEVIAEPTMPNHGHGTFPPFTTATAGETPGTYVLTDMDLFMAGIWHIAIRLTLDGTADEVAYSFDLDG
jgi:hypothetical protein